MNNPARASSLISGILKRPIITYSPKRSFYTYNTPKDTRCIVLEDGSRLIFLKKTPSPAQTALQQQQQLLITKAADAGGELPSEIEASLPPRIRTFKPAAKLTSEQISKMQQLRASDPDTWTVQRLVEEFDSHPVFVMSVTKCPEDRFRMLQKTEQERFDNLPISAKISAINRLRKKDLW
ncbi:hypothetical protein BASA50_001475 [Batrachochytrium salamandrivorans]|uniref:Ribosomal protein S24/S35 mitochondrial conserved domain-containing protein n=1 Tax=Batrachochytrium salamandrivorans TaxID=1357716 RepID=A0ABQ8FP18_9FUNG|nr:hypothetical protein BASA62_007847 [Batrachochytrium salamandrivorans]KAH6583529.1 hypothetical protein BASA60_001413 [Batrachochytrium salamandrivorans]KAH6596707.1 hypothetical protein BASA61_003401 [Batrachochytrium salamandrivorans]KAH6601617.1 hypothetical protein BASA50_001475 [Batrachochytrium salamandrivorans]KAH9250682.1 hypothetical protein BASA81_011534 [Batrachochytrium salamandrivorans]